MKMYLVGVLSLCANCVNADALLNLRINRLVSDDRGSVVDLVISNNTDKNLLFDMSDVRGKFDLSDFMSENGKVALKYRPLSFESGVMEDDEPEIVTLHSCGETNTVFWCRNRIEGVAVGDRVTWKVAKTVDGGASFCTNSVTAYGQGCICII